LSCMRLGWSSIFLPVILLLSPLQKSHFNLHFSSFRGSLVLHSDACMDYWVHSRNGWEKHINTGFNL
jgi:hypothetical protein